MPDTLKLTPTVSYDYHYNTTHNKMLTVLIGVRVCSMCRFVSGQRDSIQQCGPPPTTLVVLLRRARSRVAAQRGLGAIEQLSESGYGPCVHKLEASDSAPTTEEQEISSQCGQRGVQLAVLWLAPYCIGTVGRGEGNMCEN